MHFSIPETQELKEIKQGQSYVGYSIYANGTFHCILRYKQFYNFHDQLKKQFGPNELPYFPPKKLWPLNQIQIEERRNYLEKYLQMISQDERIHKSDFFYGFLLHAQSESHSIADKTIDLDVYLVNWFKITVKVKSVDKSSVVLKAVCKYLSIPENIVSHFSLFMMKKSGDNSMLERKMMDFESPYLTLKTYSNFSGDHRLVLLKSYWDPTFDQVLMENHVSLDLLYNQVLSDVEKGWLNTTSDIQKQLSELKATESKKEFLELARTLKYYGYVQFEPCICDYPSPNTRAIVRAGCRELIITPLSSTETVVDNIFKITRIRCWRLTTGLDDSKAPSNHTDCHEALKFEVSFEYLFSKDSLKWITIKSDQSILMSVFLRSMVGELLSKRKGISCGSNGYNGVQNKGLSNICKKPWFFMKRDGTNHPSNVSKSLSTGSFPKSESNPKIRKSISQNGSFTKMRSLVENDAFDGIGDDDL